VQGATGPADEQQSLRLRGHRIGQVPHEAVHDELGQCDRPALVRLRRVEEQSAADLNQTLCHLNHPSL
jgi:hypothetical protein